MSISEPLTFRRIGEALRTLRLAMGIEQTQAAKVIGADRTAVSKIEAGKRKVRPLELTALLDLYEATPQQREQLEALTEHRSERGWWTRYRPWITKAYAEFCGLESAASEIWDWQPAIIPGHLQTEQYARALMTAMGTPHMEQMLDVRRERRRQLERSRPAIHTVLDESVLHRIVGSADDHIAQLRQLIDAAERPNVVIQIVPYNRGAYAVGVGGFTVLSYPDGWQVVWGDTVAGDSCLEEDRPDLCIVAFDRLRSAALSEDASLELLREALEGNA